MAEAEHRTAIHQQRTPAKAQPARPKEIKLGLNVAAAVMAGMSGPCPHGYDLPHAGAESLRIFLNQDLGTCESLAI
jgi:hypothetical protein